MKFAIASDHRGVKLKSRLVQMLSDHGHDVQDFGPTSEESVDYPDFAVKVSKAVSCKGAERGILICGTGLGMCITANKFRGVRAALCFDEVTAEMSRRHNDANVLCMSADLISEQLIARITEIFAQTEFEGGRHARRIEKIADVESSSDCCGS
jgi:ribose 5-phosphate isomerase B